MRERVKTIGSGYEEKNGGILSFARNDSRVRQLKEQQHWIRRN